MLIFSMFWIFISGIFLFMSIAEEGSVLSSATILKSMGNGFLTVFVFFLYFLPSIIANKKRHKQINAIQALNIFLGWSFVGWVIALVWANTDPN